MSETPTAADVTANTGSQPAAPAASPTASPSLVNAAPAPSTPAPSTPAAPADPAAVLFPGDKPVEAPKEGDKPAAPVVPEKYEFKAPEGTALDPAAVEAFTPIAKELGLTNDQAQKLVDLQLAQSTQAQQAYTAGIKAMLDGWTEQSRTDKEFGGAKFQENVGVASAALDKFGTNALRKALDDSGMGNHPEVVRFLWKVGQTMKEDGMASGATGGGSAPRNAANILFPDLK